MAVGQVGLNGQTVLYSAGHTGLETVIIRYLCTMEMIVRGRVMNL